MSFESFNANEKEPVDNVNLGDSLINQLNEPTEKSSISDLLERNQATIMQYAANIVDHFSLVLDKLPASEQKKVVDGFPQNLGPHDVVYQGMRDHYLAKA